MKLLKDINEISLKNKAQDQSLSFELPNYHRLGNYNDLADVAKKSEKIATAIYMVTDLIGREDPLVLALRKVAIASMQTLFGTLALPQASQAVSLSGSLVQLFELNSLLGVLYSNGKISDMNHRLLNDELQKLHHRINVLTTKAMPYDRQRRSSRVIEEFTFTDDFFETENYYDNSVIKDRYPEKKIVKDTSLVLKDIKKNLKDIQKVTIENNRGAEIVSGRETVPESKENGKTKDISSSTKKETSSQLVGSKEKLSPAIVKKNERQDDVIKILKQKRDAKVGDLTNLIKGVNAKTIQRDLNDLVDQGLVTRSGDRRWSIYNLAY